MALQIVYRHLTYSSVIVVVVTVVSLCPEKKIPNIIDCHLKKEYPMLIIFCTIIFLAQLAIK